MRETDLVALIQKLAQQKARNKLVKRGIGDDCAVLQTSANDDWVFTTDFLIESRHFQLDTHSAADIGHKALARSLSDLAAMGAQPLFCLVSLAAPPARTSRWIRGFYNGLLHLADQYRITLTGGDLARFDHIIVDVMCCGRVPRGGALLRGGAMPGDFIYVTGELGGAANGLRTQRGANWKRHRRPEPRIAVGLKLRRLGTTSCMDLSDGLSLDLTRLCQASGVSAELWPDLPVSKGATLAEALHGGEDYELLFTAPAKRHFPVAVAGVRVTRIGMVECGVPSRVRFAGSLLEAAGFDHFSSTKRRT